jgi:hypothetical protein
MKLVLFGLYTWWIPQIVLSAVLDGRQPLKPMYIVGTSAARLALPLYLYGCPANLLRIPPAPRMLVLLVASVAAQVWHLSIWSKCTTWRASQVWWVSPGMTSVFDPDSLSQKQCATMYASNNSFHTRRLHIHACVVQAAVLLVQYRRGPRWFVPRCFLPPKYDYHRPAPAAILPGGSHCDALVCTLEETAGSSHSDDPMQQSLVSRGSSSSGTATRHDGNDSIKSESAALDMIHSGC